MVSRMTQMTTQLMTKRLVGSSIRTMRSDFNINLSGCTPLKLQPDMPLLTGGATCGHMEGGWQFLS